MATMHYLHLLVSCLFVCIVLNFKTSLGLVDVPCPSRAASGSIEAGQVQVIFHGSNKNQREISIDYDGLDWTSKASKTSLASLPKEGFNSSRANVIYMHAYTQSASSSWLQEVRRHYDQDGYRGQFNIMIFDWSYFSRQRYDTAASWAPKLGQTLAKFLMQLQAVAEQGDTTTTATMMSRTHLVGYSLSTHIAGLAGRYLSSKNQDAMIGRITALDPTGVCFHQGNSQFASQYSLQPTDARIVVAKHYDMGTLGASRPIGGVDVFVNGGKNQPSPARGGTGLWPLAKAVGLRVPSHSIASLNEVQDQMGDCRNVAYACSSYGAFLAGECADCGKQNAKCLDLNTMDASRTLQNSGATQNRYKLGTSMFIKTSQDSTCIYHYQAILRLKSDSLSRAQKKLIEDSLSFAFVGANKNNQSRNQIAKVNHAPDEERRLYTALLTTGNGQLADTNKIRMQLQSSNSDKQQQHQMNKLADIIDSLELNYMSHDRASERRQKSAKFCLSSNRTEDGILRKC